MSGLTTGFVVRVMRERGYEVRGGLDRAITGGVADSRQAAEGLLFTAFPGEHTDGNLYTASALANGAAAVICERAPEGDWPDRTIVVAPDATRAVSELAQAWRRACGTPVVGITGTVGKTTAKELTASVLAARWATHRSFGNLNSREGLPLALLSLRSEHEVSVLEMGMDSKGEIGRLCEIAEPRVGVVLNVGYTHVEKLGSIEAVQTEKLSLARALPESGTAVLNADDWRIVPVLPELRCGVIAFGRAEGAQLRLREVEERGLEGTRLRLCFAGATAEVRSPLPGAHTVAAALAAVGVAIALGMTLDQAAEAVGAAALAGRLAVRAGNGGARILDDRYNSSPASLSGALRLLAGLPGRRIALVGRMAELGDESERLHREAGAVAGQSCDLLVAVGDECRALAEGAREAGGAEVRWFANKDEAAAFLGPRLREGDMVLVKASRGHAFETLLPALGVEA